MEHLECWMDDHLVLGMASKMGIQMVSNLVLRTAVKKVVKMELVKE